MYYKFLLAKLQYYKTLKFNFKNICKKLPFFYYLYFSGLV